MDIILTFDYYDKENVTRVYHMGDTDFIPEMKEIQDIDILLIPISGKYVMTLEEAVDACNEINPKVAIPMHFDAGIAGNLKDAKKFKNLVNCEVEILEPVTS